MNIKEARRHFEECGCSSFHMYRDDWDKYEQYRALKIPKEQEHAWRRDRINAVAAELAAAVSVDSDPFLTLVHLCENQWDAESLQTLKDATTSVHKLLSPHARVVVAEQFIRSPIYLAVHLDDKTTARHFAETARALAEHPDTRAAEPTRSARVLATYTSELMKDFEP